MIALPFWFLQDTKRRIFHYCRVYVIATHNRLTVRAFSLSGRIFFDNVKTHIDFNVKTKVYSLF